MSLSYRRQDFSWRGSYSWKKKKKTKKNEVSCELWKRVEFECHLSRFHGISASLEGFKLNVGLKTLLHQGLSEPEFYGGLVYKFKKIVGRADFSDQFRKIIVRYKPIGNNKNIMRQSACLVFNPITVNNFDSLFNCPPVGRASDCDLFVFRNDPLMS